MAKTTDTKAVAGDGPPADAPVSPQGATESAGSTTTQIKSEPPKSAKPDAAPAFNGQSPVTEGMYSVADLTGAARTRFNVSPEIAAAALRMAGKQKATLAEAKRIIEAFMSKEVN